MEVEVKFNGINNIINFTGILLCRRIENAIQSLSEAKESLQVLQNEASGIMSLLYVSDHQYSI